ncbi:MAG: sodium:proton antiporter [Anaerovoracaceae bacterium]|jgi:Na+/H+ antiporter NhaD/arsenite permease-like protein
MGGNISLIYCIPFVGMLLSIALFPVLKPEWWEKHELLVSLLWSLLFIVMFTIGFGFKRTGTEVADSLLEDYVPFIVLLFGLFCITGNITMDSNLDGSPRVNLLMLLVGTILASWIGTTGASMLMIRPMIRSNQWRKRKKHTFIFFIFLVSNMGGVLTPVGDPPLLMGFMRNVPFFWSMHLLPVLLLNAVILLTIYYFLDVRAFSTDVAEGLHPGNIGVKSIRVRGLHNVIFLLMVVFAVILRGYLSSSPTFEKNYGIGVISMTGTTYVELAIILVACVLSFMTTKKEIREMNAFSWAPIKEVAILFFGIFITMIPALLILHAKGGELGLTEPYQMFWATGLMSSFLDNTPTYMVFLTTAGALGAKAGIHTTVGIVSQKMLMAISAGAVFMGANTYIGNAPNFMVKSIAEENKVEMPSFFGYMKWSIGFLIPVFILDMFLFLM